MKHPVLLFMLLLLITGRAAAQPEEDIMYSDRELENFLDSIGKLSPSALIKDASGIPDSIFYSLEDMNQTISDTDFEKLKEIFSDDDEYDWADTEFVKRIFKDFELDSEAIGTGLVNLTCFRFGEGFDEFAVCGSGQFLGWEKDVYFFKGNRVVAKHHYFFRYEMDIKHYKDSDGKTVVYYEECFGSGSGVWQFNHFFYKYAGNRLVPVLNIPENGNLSIWGTPRAFWLKTSVVKTQPLVLKFEYNVRLFDTAEIINNSTTVEYTYNDKIGAYTGNYAKAPISESQMLTYTLFASEQLFINTHYKLLKQLLANKAKRKTTLLYLNSVKNSYRFQY